MRSPRHIVLRLFASKKARYAVAAITLLFVIFLVIILRNFILLSPASLYREAYVPFIVSTIHGGYTRPKDSTEINYEQGNYQYLVQTLRKRKTLTDEEELLFGLSYLQLADYSRSIMHLKKATEHNNSFTPDATFYLSMAYLLNQDYDLSIELITRIVHQPDHPYRSRFSEGYIRKVKLLKWK